MSVWDTVIKTLTGGNRRSWNRDPVSLAVNLHVGELCHGLQIADVSPAGAFLTPAIDMPIGTPGILEIPGALIRAEVKIVRQTPTGVGVEFIADGVGAIVAGWTRGVSPDP
jgi:hypothetical protein